jgi:DNA-binding NarL/FixJ family response regulator
MTTRVLVVDDHPVFRDGLAALLAATPGLAVTGTASDAESALSQLAEVEVDVVLMDLNLPGMSGVEATRAIAAYADGPAVLVVTMVDDDDTVLAAMRAGARGYILKGSTGDEIAAAVRTVASGGATFGGGVAARILQLTSSRGAATPATTPVDGLTEREREVLALLADGESNARIARRLDLSHKTVQNYVSRILDKLQVADRTQAALLARRLRDERTPTGDG